MRGLIRAVLAALIAAGAFTAMISAAVSAPRGPEAYRCLIFDNYASGRQIGSFVLNIANGLTLPFQRPAPPIYREELPAQPGGRYGLKLVGEAAAYYSLLLTVRGTTGPTLTLQSGLSGQIRVVWSPDGEWLAAVWRAADQEYYLGVFGPFPTTRESLPFTYGARIEALPDVPEEVVWSPDSRTLIYRAILEPNLHRLEVATGRRMETFIGDQSIFGPSWSPDGAYMALVTLGDPSQLVLIGPEGKATFYALETSVTDTRFSWSPDSRHLALSYVQAWPYYAHRVLTVGEGLRPPFAVTALRGDAITGAVLHWSPDSRTVAYSQERRGGDGGISSWDWMAYHVAGGYSLVVADSLRSSPQPSPTDPNWVAIHQDVWGKQSLSVMNRDGSRRVDLITNADDMGDPYWSPDGRYIAAVWATGHGSRRVVRLMWARADGAEVRTLSEGLWDARDLRWLGGRLVFVSVRGGADGRPIFGLEWVDLASGKHGAWLAGREEIGNVRTLPDGSLQLWWRGDGLIGVEGYALDGTRQYRHILPAEGLPSVAGSVFQNELVSIEPPGAPRLFPAPNGPAALIKIGELGNENLFLVGVGQSAIPLRRGLSGLGDPLWSPDGQFFAFTQSINRAPITLEVVTVDGQNVPFPSPSQHTFARLEWSTCAFLAGSSR